MAKFEERKGEKRDQGKDRKSEEKTPWENEENKKRRKEKVGKWGEGWEEEGGWGNGGEKKKERRKNQSSPGFKHLLSAWEAYTLTTEPLFF